jgi:hypothetical protein
MGMKRSQAAQWTASTFFTKCSIAISVVGTRRESPVVPGDKDTSSFEKKSDQLLHSLCHFYMGPRLGK